MIWEPPPLAKFLTLFLNSTSEACHKKGTYKYITTSVIILDAQLSVDDGDAPWLNLLADDESEIQEKI